MANKSGSSPVSRYKPLGGSARNYLDTSTGEILSRRQYDKIAGTLKEFGSYEKKAKFNRETNPQLALARPHRGKPSTVKQIATIDQRALNLSSTGEKFQDLLIKIHYKNDEPDFTRLNRDFTSFIDGLKKNKRIFSVVTNLMYRADNEILVRNLIPATRWPTVAQLGEALLLWSEDYDLQGDEKLLNLSMHCMFTSAYLDSLHPRKPRRK